MPMVNRVLDETPCPDLTSYIAAGGGVGLQTAVRFGSDGTIEELEAAGLRGRGGAGFPTAIKWRTVIDATSAGHPTTVVVNGAEGEPGTFKDRAILRANPYRVIEGALIAARTIGATRVVIGLRASFDTEIRRVTAALDEMVAAGWLDDVEVDVVGGPGEYLYGEETGLLEVLDHRQPFPRVTPPYRRGVDEPGGNQQSAGGVDLAGPGGTDAPPALVNNVETMAHVAMILANGAEWFRELGTVASPGTIVCTVTGARRLHGVAEFPMGTTLAEVIETIGGSTDTEGEPMDEVTHRERRIMAVLPGVANGIIPGEWIHTELTHEALRAIGSGLGSAGFIVFDDSTDPRSIAGGVARFLAVESCGQCEPCKRDGKALDRLINGDAGDHALTEGVESSVETIALEQRLETIIDGARCGLAQQQQTVIGSIVALFPDRFTEAGLHAAHDSERVHIAPIADIVNGRATLEDDAIDKQPDWSHAAQDSGRSPAAWLAGREPTVTRVTIGRTEVAAR